MKWVVAYLAILLVIGLPHSFTLARSTMAAAGVASSSAASAPSRRENDCRFMDPTSV